MGQQRGRRGGGGVDRGEVSAPNRQTRGNKNEKSTALRPRQQKVVTFFEKIP